MERADSTLTQRADIDDDVHEFCATHREDFGSGLESDKEPPPAVIRLTRVDERGSPVPGAECFDLAVGTHCVGSRDTNKIVLADATVSGLHARLEVQEPPAALLVLDMSTNGTFNSRRTGSGDTPKRLANGQWEPVPYGARLRFGPCTFLVDDAQGALGGSSEPSLTSDGGGKNQARVDDEDVTVGERERRRACTAGSETGQIELRVGRFGKVVVPPTSARQRPRSAEAETSRRRAKQGRSKTDVERARAEEQAASEKRLADLEKAHRERMRLEREQSNRRQKVAVERAKQGGKKAAQKKSKKKVRSGSARGYRRNRNKGASE